MVNLSRLRNRSWNYQNYQLHERPSRERHLVAVLASMLSIMFLVLALAMKEWATASNISCKLIFGLTSVHVEHKNSNSNLENKNKDYGMTEFYKEDQQILISCIISVTILIILSSLIATVVSLGYPREKLEFLRHFSVFNIVSLLCMVLVSGLWLAVVQSLPNGTVNVSNCNFESGSIHFGYCYYILLVGALFSLVATSFNLLFARTAVDRRRRMRLRLRQQQSRWFTEPRLLCNHRELTGLNLLPPACTTYAGGEAETYLGELEQSGQTYHPVSLPPAYSL